MDQYRKFFDKLTNLQRNSLPILASTGISLGLIIVRPTKHRKIFSQVVTGITTLYSFMKLPSPLNLAFLVTGNYLSFVGIQALEGKEEDMKNFEFLMLTYTHIVGVAAYLILE